MTLIKVQQSSSGYGSIKPVDETSCFVDHIDQIHSSIDTMKRNAVSQQVALITFGVSLLVISFVLSILFYPSSSSFAPASSSSTISMVTLDSSSNEYDDHDQNQNLIKILQSPSTTIHPQSFYKDKVHEFPSMSIDLEHERQIENDNVTTEQTTITVSWTDGEFRDSKDSILSDETNDQNIIALQCGKSESQLHSVIVETLSDATSSSSSSKTSSSSTSSDMITDNSIRYRNLRTSNRRQLTQTKWFHWDKKDHHDHHDDDKSKWQTFMEHKYEYTNTYGTNVWYIPSLPDSVLNEQHQRCQAVIYYYINDDEYVIISKSTFVYL
jgi:hypothetical protein